MAYPRFQRARAFKFKTRTAGSVTVSATTPGAVDTALDIALNAQVGDVIELALAGYWNPPSGATNSPLDVATMNGSTVINYVSSGTSTFGANGVINWLGPSQTAQQSAISGSFWYTVQAADIVAGLVTLRLFAWNGTASMTRLLFAAAGAPLVFAAKNLGPVDPN